MEVGEVQFSLPVGIEAKADAFIGEGFADMMISVLA